MAKDKGRYWKWRYVKFKTRAANNFLRKKFFYLWAVFFFNCMGYWRHIEFPYVMKRIFLQKGVKKILDISSPKELSMFLSKFFKITAIDLWEMELKRWEKMITKLNDKTINKNLSLEKQDATKLTYPDNSFDAVYSVSVIEHIGDDGDIKAMKEIRRVLKKGGTAAITVPYNKKAFNKYIQKSHYFKKYSSKPLFYSRWYDLKSLKKRIIKPSRMKLVDLEIYDERIPLAFTFFEWITPLKKKIRLVGALNVFLFHTLGYLNFFRVRKKKWRKVNNGVAALTLVKK